MKHVNCSWESAEEEKKALLRQAGIEPGRSVLDGGFRDLKELCAIAELVGPSDGGWGSSAQRPSYLRLVECDVKEFNDDNL